MAWAHTHYKQIPYDTVRNFKPDNPMFEPALRAWISNADNYEKEVAYNLFNALNGGMSVKPPATNKATRLRSRSATPSCGRNQKPPGPTKAYYRMPTAGVRTSAPATNLYQQRDDQLSVIAKSLGRDDLPQQRYTMMNGPSSGRPRAVHLPRHPQARDYTHENSFFMNSLAPYKGSFIIHPDWVSEAKLSRKVPGQMTNKEYGLRYGSN